MSNDTNNFFKHGKLTIVMDGGAGSSGKGKMASFLGDKADNWTFACNSFAPQAGHWVRLDDGRQFFYQTLNSVAYNVDKYEKLYIGPGATLELPALMREIEENKVPDHKLGISPLALILEDFDAAYERGERGFDNTPLMHTSEGTMKTGSTCLPANVAVETEDGLKSIKWIVDNEYDGRVKSLDANGKFVLSKVIGWQALRNTDKKRWVSVDTAQRCSKLRVTADHRVACIDDVLRPEIKYVEARHLVGKYVVQNNKQSANNYDTNALFGPNQVSAMIGCLLGDGMIHKGAFTCDHGPKQNEYLAYKHRLFGGTISHHKSGWSDDTCSRLSTANTAQTKLLRKMLYKSGKKRVDDAIKYLDMTGLAFWYMDDGSLVTRPGKSPNMIICTDLFTNNELKTAIAWFHDIFGSTDVTISHRNRLRIGSKTAARVSKAIASLVPECLKYKLLEEDRDTPFVELKADNQEYAAAEVVSVDDLDISSKLYDIEVKDTHNFIANRVVVHNCHGVGSAAARRILRSPSVRTAKDIPELKKYLCDVPAEISARLDRGESGLMELAQGFQLSLLHSRFAPHTTSRQVTVAQGMSDLFLPTKYAGPVIVNLRTYPIRINSNKFIGQDGRHLTWAEVEAGVPHTVYHGDSGGWYPDQHEITWEQLTASSGSPTKIMEVTSVTKLPRRVATFSKMNAVEALKYNDTGDDMYLSINFANYVDHNMSGKTNVAETTQKFNTWLKDSLGDLRGQVVLVGTGAKTSETIIR